MNFGAPTNQLKHQSRTPNRRSIFPTRIVDVHGSGNIPRTPVHHPHSQQLGIQDRVFGPLFELFECEEVYRTAVEVIGGASLFHVVVEDDEVAGRLLDIMNKERSGRVTFMPLNRLRPSRIEYPEIIEDGELQALPLVNQLKSDSRFIPALEQVFGKTMLVFTLALGSMIAKKHSLNAVTLDGDRVDRRGALTGGFIDHKKSRLAAIHAHRHWQSKLDEQQLLLSKVRDLLLQAEQAVTRVTAEIQRHSGSDADINEFLDASKRELASTSEILQAKTKSIEAVKSSLRHAQQESELLRAELGTSLKDANHGTRLKELMREIESKKGMLADVIMDCPEHPQNWPS